MLALLLLAAGWRPALGGGGPQNVLVVINTNSPGSREAGLYYAHQHGVPARNLCWIGCATNNDISLDDYSNLVRRAVLDHVDAAGLSNQVDYLVFMPDIPYRVYQGNFGEQRHAGLTACMLYDFKASPNAFTAGCEIAASSDNPYFYAERAFTHAGATGSNRLYLATQLTGWSLDLVKHTIDRACAAEGSQPTGQVYLLHTSDPYRNKRWPQFDNADFAARFLAASQTWIIAESDAISGASNVVGYLTGVESLAPTLFSNQFAPGALGDHMTSYGGSLLDLTGQMSILDWLAAGAVASYGTCVEPCSYTRKFPAAMAYYWQARGFNAAESLWMAVQNPYQGVVAGDPLSAPYAQPASLAVTGLAANAVLSNSATLAITARGGRPVSRVDLFLDGLWLATATNLAPEPGNAVTFSLNGHSRTCTVQAGDTIYDVAAGLEAAINAAPPIGLTATARADCVELRQAALGIPGATNACAAVAAQGAAGRLTLWAQTPFTHLLETRAAAYERVDASGTPIAGDLLRSRVTRLDGAVVTNTAIADGDDSAYDLLLKLLAAVNADPALQDSQGCMVKYQSGAGGANTVYFVARTNGWAGGNLFLDFEVVTQPGSGLDDTGFSSLFDDNADDLGARAMVFLGGGQTNLAAGYTLSATNLANGPHDLLVVACEGTALETQARVTVPFTVSNSPLNCAVTAPRPWHNAPLDALVTTRVAAAGSLVITQVALWAEGRLLARTNAAEMEAAWPAAAIGAGLLNLQAQAWDAGGATALSPAIPVRVFTDEDGDGLPGWWEYQYFGTATGATAAADTDLDSVPNLGEYLGATDPTNAASYFAISSVASATGFPVQVAFPGSAMRLYQVAYNDQSLLFTNAWQAAFTALLWGSDAPATWVDTCPTPPCATNGYRFYRVKAVLP